MPSLDPQNKQVIHKRIFCKINPIRTKAQIQPSLYYIYFSKKYARLTRVNNVSQSARLFTFCVLDQSECVKLTTCQQKERENNTLFYVFRAIRYCILYSGTERL